MNYFQGRWVNGGMEEPLPVMSSTTSTLNWNDMNMSIYGLYSAGYASLTNLITYPSDLLTTRLQADKYYSHKNVKIIKVTNDLIRREGIKGLLVSF